MVFVLVFGVAAAAGVVVVFVVVIIVLSSFLLLLHFPALAAAASDYMLSVFFVLFGSLHLYDFEFLSPRKCI